MDNGDRRVLMPGQVGSDFSRLVRRTPRYRVPVHGATTRGSDVCKSLGKAAVDECENRTWRRVSNRGLHETGRRARCDENRLRRPKDELETFLHAPKQCPECGP